MVLLILSTKRYIIVQVHAHNQLKYQFTKYSSRQASTKTKEYRRHVFDTSKRCVES